MRSLFFLLIFLNSLSVFSQEQRSYDIEISASAIINGLKMDINISREPDRIKILYRRRDSVDRKSLEADSRISRLRRKLMKSINKKSKKDEERREELLLGISKYDSYYRDSLLLIPAEVSQYTSLIDSIYTTDEKTLNKSLKSVIILDGTSIHITIKENGETIKKAYAHSPRENTYPLIYRLMSSTLDLYRDRNPDSFLEKKHTNGY